MSDAFDLFDLRPLLVLALLMAVACSDPTVSEEEPVFTLEMQNVSQQFVEPLYTPEFTVEAVNSTARSLATRPGGLDEVFVRWPDGSFTSLEPLFTEDELRVFQVKTDESVDTPLPPGTYELVVRYADLKRVTFENEWETEPLGPIEDLVVVGQGDRSVISWTSPEQAHSWEATLFRVIPRDGPDEAVLVRTLASGQAEGGSELSVGVPHDELEEGEYGRVDLTLSNEGNLLTASVGVAVGSSLAGGS